MLYTYMESPVGKLFLARDDEGLRALKYKGAPEQGWVENRTAFKEVIAQLESYFAGELKEFNLFMKPEGTPFQKEAWAALGTIPYGKTVSYGEQARRMGRPNAGRAVGAANGRNPISIIIPCHRVIGAGGRLTGYGGGLDVKRRLLDLEQGGAGLFRSGRA
jgi:methylated-DNA-[protein]-cysteine S-methyltransferase